MFPEFRDRDNNLKSQLLKELNKKREAKGQKVASKKKSQTAEPGEEGAEGGEEGAKEEINFEFLLLPFQDEDLNLRMDELPKKLKWIDKKKTILTVKKHIHNYLKSEPIDNIEILCKNFAVNDNHSMAYVHKTKWQNGEKRMVLHYRR